MTVLFFIGNKLDFPVHPANDAILTLQSRVVPGFLVQTGDRTGSGAGGESFYGGTYPESAPPRTHKLAPSSRTLRR